MKRKANKKRTGIATQLRRKRPTALIMGVVVAGLVIAVWYAVTPSSRDVSAEVAVPELSAIAATGKTLFDANCAQCHGANAAGTKKGPPLVNDIYNPGHHSDQAFFMAARRGVGRHHWPYGDMPPQLQVTDRQLVAIVRYVRELQEANGIFYRPHNM